MAISLEEEIGLKQIEKEFLKLSKIKVILPSGDPAEITRACNYIPGRDESASVPLWSRAQHIEKKLRAHFP